VPQVKVAQSMSTDLKTCYNKRTQAKETQMNFKDRDSVIDSYAQTILDGMDIKSMERFVYDTLVENLTDYTNEELATEIVEGYGEEWFADNDLEVNETV
jgi:hypothetical protein